MIHTIVLLRCWLSMRRSVVGAISITILGEFSRVRINGLMPARTRVPVYEKA